MFYIPGFVKLIEQDGSTTLKSTVHGSVVKIDTSKYGNELNKILNDGINVLSTELQNFLFKEKILLEEEEINVTIEKVFKATDKILHIVMMPTDACNFSCLYCYEKHNPKYMDRNIVDKIIAFIQQQENISILNVCWFGGEPTLCMDIIEYFSTEMLSYCNTNKIIYKSNITSNGSLLTNKYFEQLIKSGIDNFQITIDGWHHDNYRKNDIVGGSRNLIINNLLEIKKYAKNEYPYTIIIRRNLTNNDNDFTWYDFLKSHFGDDERFQFIIMPVSDWGGERIKSINLIETDEVLKHHIDYAKKIGLNLYDDDKDVFLSLACYAAYKNSYIFRANGKIEKCTICIDNPSNCIGEIGNKVALDSDKTQLWEEPHIRKECYTCKYILSCVGRACPKNNIIDVNSNKKCYRKKAYAYE